MKILRNKKDGKEINFERESKNESQIKIAVIAVRFEYYHIYA